MVIEQIGLQADLVAAHVLRAESLIIRGTRARAPGPIARGVPGIAVNRAAEVIGDVHRRVETVPGAVQRLIAICRRRGRIHHERQVGRIDRAGKLRIGVDDVTRNNELAFLVVMREAAADRDVQIVVGVPGDVAIGRIAARANLRRTVDRAAARGRAKAGRTGARIEDDKLIAGRLPGGRVAGDRDRIRRRRVIPHALIIVEEAQDVIDLADGADRLEFLAELVLKQIGQAVAAEVAGVSGAARPHDRRTVRAAAIVPLRCRNAAPRGDRAKLDFGRHVPGAVESIAMGPVDARLLRHANVRNVHPAIAIDHYARQQRSDSAGQVGVIGAGKRAVGLGGLCAGGAVVGIVVQQLTVERRVRVIAFVKSEIEAEIVGRPPFHLGTDAVTVIIVPAGRARQGIPGGRILMLDDAVELDPEIVEFRQVQVDFGAVAAVIADAAADPAAEFAGRPGGDDVERAALGVAPEQSSLRPSQNLHPRDVEQGRVETVLAAEIDAIDIDADALLAGRLVGVERHDAANADSQRGLARLEGRDAERRHGAVGEIVEALDVAVLHGLRVDDADRYRRALQVGLAAGRGHDDVGEALVRRWRLVGRCDLGLRLALGRRRRCRRRILGVRCLSECAERHQGGRE